MADRTNRIIIDVVATSAINNIRKIEQSWLDAGTRQIQTAKLVEKESAASLNNIVSNHIKAAEAQNKAERQKQAEIDKTDKANEKSSKKSETEAKRRAKEVDAISQQTQKSAERFVKQSQSLDDKLTAQRIANANKSAKAAADSFLKHLDQVNSGEKGLKERGVLTDFLKSAGGGSFAGSFLGASAGGAAGMAAQKLFSELASGAGILKDLSIEAIKVGGNFQITKNSLEVAAGSARLANLELAGINQTAKDTAGLRLETAEQGYTNLRNLGFSAKLAKGFIKELAEEKILSGANEDAMQRVTFNFAQIASGGQKVSQELREILTALPSLRTSFYEAFGSLNPQKIQQFFDEDSDKAFQRLVDAMGRGKAAAGGLNDGVGKLEDAWIEAQRSFSEPTLEPLTKILRDLTKDVNNNEGTFRTWGENVAKVLNLVSNTTESKFVSTILKIEDYSQRLALLTLTMGATGGSSAGEIGKGLKKKMDEASRLAGFYSTGVFTPDLSQFQPSFKGANKFLDKYSKQPETSSEKAKRLANEEFDTQQKIEKSRVKSLEFSKYTRDQQIQLSENYYAVESARFSSYTARTLAEELGFQKAIGKTKSDGIRSQIAIQNAYYAATFPKLAGDKEETVKLTIEKNKTLADLNRQLAENNFQTQKQAFETERQIIKQRLDAQIDYKKSSAEIVRKSLEIGSFNTDRNLNLFGYSANAFNQVKDETVKAYQQLARISSEQFQILLQNDTLTAEQRINIQREMQSEQSNLAEEQRRKLLEIGDKQYSGFIAQQESYQKRASQIYQSFASSYSAIGGLFSADTFNGNTAKTIRETLLQTGKLADLQKQLSASRAAEKNISDQLPFGTDKSVSVGGLQAANDGYTKAINESTRLQKEIDALGNSIPKVYNNFVALGEQIGKGNVKAFDEAAKSALNYRQKLERSNIDSEIEHYRDIATSGLTTTEKSEAQLKLVLLGREKERLAISQATESNQLYQKSLEGLQNTLTQMRNGEKSAFVGLDYLNQQKILTAQIDDITAAYNKETDAVISLNRVKSELLNKGFFSQNQSDAIFLEEMNSRIKSTNQIVAEFKLGIADGFVSPVESLFDRINGKIDKLPAGIREVTGAFSNLFQELTKQAANQFVMRLLGFNTGGGFQQGGFQNTGGFAGGSGASGILNSGLNMLTGGGGSPSASGGASGDFGGAGSLLSKIPLVGKLLGFGGSKAASAASTILTPDKVTGAAESMLNFGGSGAAGGSSMLGSLTPFLTNPWTIAAVGAGIGSYFLFRHLFGDKSEKKLKEAVSMDYGIKIDKEDAKALKTIGEQQLGAGAGEKRPHEVIKLEEAKNLIRAIGEQQGKDTSKLGYSREDLLNENSKANRFTLPFGGYREHGGSVRPNMAYIVGERRPELFVPQTNGTIIPQVGGGNVEEIVKRCLQPFAELIQAGMMASSLSQQASQAVVEKVDAMPPDHVLTKSSQQVFNNKFKEATQSQNVLNRMNLNNGGDIYW